VATLSKNQSAGLGSNRKQSHRGKKIERMDQSDDGYFHYDDRFPPFCLRPMPKSSAKQRPRASDEEMSPPASKRAKRSGANQAVNTAIVTYLQESYKDGLKDPHNILPCGLSAAEAAVLYFRDINDRRKKIVPAPSIPVETMLARVKEALLVHMNIEVNDDEDTFQHFVNSELFAGARYKQKLFPALKSYLAQSQKKSKGYTQRLKSVVRDVLNPSNCEILSLD
jgi:hypothetical protein